MFIQGSSDFLNSLPKDKILALTKLQAFADDKFNVAKIVNYVFETVENIVGKRRKFRLPAFFPFPTMFWNVLCDRVVKNHHCVEKSKCFKPAPRQI